MNVEAIQKTPKHYEALWSNLYQENKAVLKDFNKRDVDLSKKQRLSFRAKFATRDAAQNARVELLDNYDLGKHEKILLRTVDDPQEEFYVCFDVQVHATPRTITEYEFALRVYSEPHDPITQFWVFQGLS